MVAIMFQPLWITHEQLETDGCIPSTVATEALVLIHQAISTTVLTKYSL